MILDGILTITVTLIILLVLFKKISLTLFYKEELSIIIDTGIISLTLSKLEGDRRKNREFSHFIPGIKFLLKGSSLCVKRLVLSNLESISKKHKLKIPFFILISSLIPFVTRIVKSISYRDDAYLVDLCDGKAPEISVRFDFFIFRLIISLLIVAYYKLKYALKRGLNHARRQNGRNDKKLS